MDKRKQIVIVNDVALGWHKQEKGGGGGKFCFIALPEIREVCAPAIVRSLHRLFYE